HLFSLLCLSPPTPNSTLFPYTTLFRSNLESVALDRDSRQLLQRQPGRRVKIAVDLFQSELVDKLVDRRAPIDQPGSIRPSLDILDRKSTRLNSSHQIISYAVFCLKKKK